MLAPETTPEEIIQTLMKSAAPERAEEIDVLWMRYHPKVSVVANRSGTKLDATKDRIEFDIKTMDVLWLIGFSGWRAIECYMPHILISAASGETLHESFKDDLELPEIERAFIERLAGARNLIYYCRDIDDVSWPADVPHPLTNRDALESSQEMTAYDLVLIATAFAFFHEFRHVMLDRDGERPIDRREEELQCDVWAREFMTVKLASYAKDNGHNFQEVLRKRSMGFALAGLILHEITPKYELINTDYFSIRTRLTSLLDDTRLPENDYFWLFAASLLIGIFRREHHAFKPPAMPARSLTEYLLNLLPE